MRGKISREKLTFRPRDIKNGGFLVVEVISMCLHFARICILQGLHFARLAVHLAELALCKTKCTARMGVVPIPCMEVVSMQSIGG